MAILDQLKSRVLASSRSGWVVTPYCQKSAAFRRVDVELAIENVRLRPDCLWTFSQHAGMEGTRLDIYLRVSRHKTHLYVVEVNAAIYFVNVIVIEWKKQRRLKTYDA